MCSRGSRGATGKGRTRRRSWNWRLVAVQVGPGPETVLCTEAHNCGDCPPGSGRGDWGDWRAKPAESAEEWKPWVAERENEASLGDCCEGNRMRPFEVYSPGCGRYCSAPRWGKGPLLVGFGNAAVSRGNLTTGGESPERRGSPGWAGSQEG